MSFMAATDHSSASHDTAGNAPEQLADVQHSLNSQVRTLLLECSNREELATGVLDLCASQFGSTVERFDLRISGRLHSQVSHRETMPDALAERLSSELMGPMSEQSCSAEDPQPRLKQLRKGDQIVTVISVPVMDLNCDRIEGAITLLIGGQPRPELVLPRLDGVAAVVSTVLAVLADSRSERSVEQGVPHDASAAPNESDSPADALRRQSAAVAKVSSFTSTREFGYSIVNSLCDQLKAEQVFFGVEQRQKIVVEAVSGVADFKPASPGIAAVRQAMEECLDATAAIVAQQPPLSDVPSMPIHRQWAASSQNSCVCSVPIRSEDRITGVVSLRRPSDQPFSSDELARLSEILQPYGAALPLIAKANAPVSQVIRSAAADAVSSLAGRGRIGRRILLALAVTGLMWFLFGSITYRPLCSAKVIAADLHHLAAPFDGQLRAVHTTAGREVNAGDLLLEFDTTDLRLELNRLHKDIGSSQVRLREAIRIDDISQAAIARSHIRVLTAQAAAVVRQIEAATIRAPSDGTVILADLDQRIGQEFSQGEELLQFTSGRDWLLEIEVPDDIVHYIDESQSGAFAAAALPTDRQSFLIQRIDGAATTRRDRNVFIARATVSANPSWMRSGMEGTARIESVPRPVWWVTLHRVIDWARSGFWI